MVALITPADLPGLTSLRVLRGMMRAFQRRGYALYLVPSNDRGPSIFERVEGHSPVGIFCLEEPQAQVLGQVDRDRVPIVDISDAVLSGHFPLDKILARGSELQMEHLVSRGRKNLAYVTMHGWGIPPVSHRQDEVLASLTKRFHLPQLPKLVLPAVPADHSWALEPKSVSEAIAAFLRTFPKIDGFICADDEVAMALVAGLRESGKMVPADVSVVGRGDYQFAPMTDPPLSTVGVDLGNVSCLLAASVLRAMGQPLGTEVDLSDQQLVVRRST